MYSFIGQSRVSRGIFSTLGNRLSPSPRGGKGSLDAHKISAVRAKNNSALHCRIIMLIFVENYTIYADIHKELHCIC